LLFTVSAKKRRSVKRFFISAKRRCFVKGKFIVFKFLTYEKFAGAMSFSLVCYGGRLRIWEFSVVPHVGHLPGSWAFQQSISTPFNVFLKVFNDRRFQDFLAPKKHLKTG
jgi:hypothetical protein